MATHETEQKFRPFHETILVMINRAIAREMGELAILIRTTKITKNHDHIIAAWIKQKEVSGWDWDEEKMGVVVSLIEQKLEAETAVTDLASSFHSNGKERALMIVVETMVRLVQEIPIANIQEQTRPIFKLFEVAKKIFWAKDEKEFRAAIADL